MAGRGLLNSPPFPGGLLAPQSSGLLGGMPAFATMYPEVVAGQTLPAYRPSEEQRAAMLREVLPDLAPAQIIKGMARGVGNLVMQAHEAMPWGGNNPLAIGIDVQQGSIDPSVMVPFAVDAAGMATTGSLAAPAVKNATGMGIRAYHGSPHDFDRFSMDKIGTGEGAQAYGHGLYFAENPGVAGEYRKQLTRRDGGAKMVTSYDVGGKHIAQSSPDWPAADVAGIMRQHGIDPSTPDGMDWLDSELGARRMSGVINDTDEARAKVLDFYKADDFKSETVPGRMYEVDIDASPDEFLDWDKPLSEQPEVMARLSKSKRKAVQNLLAQERFADLSKNRELYGRDLGPLTGEDLIKALSLDLEGKTVGAKSGEALRAAGIKGIRYKDAGSRSTEGGTSNYVVFDDKNINILKKYGIAGLMAGGAGAAALGSGTQDASAAPASYSTGGRF